MEMFNKNNIPIKMECSLHEIGYLSPNRASSDTETTNSKAGWLMLSQQTDPVHRIGVLRFQTDLFCALSQGLILTLCVQRFSFTLFLCCSLFSFPCFSPLHIWHFFCFCLYFLHPPVYGTLSPSCVYIFSVCSLLSSICLLSCQLSPPPNTTTQVLRWIVLFSWNWNRRQSF